MVFGHDDGKRIVRSQAGAGTMDTLYFTADGECWMTGPMVAAQIEMDRNATMPAPHGHVHRGRIFRD